MDPLSRAHHDWPSLLAAARTWPAYASLAAATDEQLRLLLQAPVAVAWWISTFQPALAARDSLEVVLVCAGGGPASTDDGRPYQLVAQLLGRGDLRIAVTMIMGEAGTAPVPSVTHARSSISLRARAGGHSAPALVFPGTLDEWWTLHPNNRPDLCLLFHPGFDEDADFWCGLRPFLAAGVPVGAFARGPEKVARDAWLLGAYGYAVEPAGAPNLWAVRRPESFGHGPWAAMGWQLEPSSLPPPDFEIDHARLARARQAQQFVEHEFRVWNPHEFIGRIQTVEGDRSADPEQFVGLPDHFAVSMATGEVWAVEPDAMVPAPGGIRLPASVLATYPGAHAHCFDQLLWAVETYEHEYRTREAARLRSAYTADVQELQIAAALTGKASAAEIATITEFFSGGAPTTAATLGSEPLFTALAKRDWERAATLFAADPGLARAQDVEGRSPLFYAIAGRRYELARQWLEAGADPNHLDHEGFAVVHDAAKRDLVEPLQLLHRHGADLDLATGLGFTPAMLALRYGRWSVLAYLLSQGVDLNKTALAGASVADQYKEVTALPRVLRREIERRLGRPAFIPIAARHQPSPGPRLGL